MGDFAATVGLLAATVGGLGVLAKTPPARFILRWLVVRPFDEWTDRKFDSHLDPIRAELNLNGGKSVKDAVIRVKDTVTRIEGEVRQVRDRIEEIGR